MTQDLDNYTAAYYERDQTFARHGILRSDQLAALCYALNWPFWGSPAELARTERHPGKIVSVGAGRGELEAQLERLGFDVTGVDPSVGADEKYQGTHLVSVWTPRQILEAQTIIFCESIEHIPLEQTLDLLQYLSPGARLIIVNFLEFWPLMPSSEGWDHITQVDEAVYDRLCEGRTVIERRGSHLVLDIP